MHTVEPQIPTAEQGLWSRSVGLLKRNPIPFVLLLWLVGWILIGVFGKPTLPSFRSPIAPSVTKPAVPEHRMSEVMRRNAVKPLDNSSRFARIDQRLESLDGRVSVLEKWRDTTGRKRVSPPKTAAKKAVPARQPEPPSRPFTIEQGDWTPNWDRLLGRRE